MGFFKNRSDYFKSLANQNKLVAHGRNIDGEVRNSFHRMNSDDELMAACVNWAHFPCVVLWGFAGRYTGDKNNYPKRKHSTDLYFLHKLDEVTNMDEMEMAYDTAFEVMEEFISKMYNEFSTLGYCSNFHNIDLGRFSFSSLPVMGPNLLGWQLSFEDDLYADSITKFDSTKWFDQ